MMPLLLIDDVSDATALLKRVLLGQGNDKEKPASATDAGFLGGRVHATGRSMLCTYSIMADDSECKLARRRIIICC
jgi:hypothetical protein